MKREDVKRLQWFIDFAYCDFEKLESGEMAKLMDEIVGLSVSAFFERMISHDEIIEISKSLKSRGHIDLESHERVRLFQKAFRSIFENIMDKIVHLPDFEKSEWVSYDESESADKGIPLLPDPFPINLQIEAAVRMPLEYNYEENKTRLRWRRDWRENSTISIRAEPVGSSEMVLLFIFLKSMNSLPLKYFRRCEECGHWFLHVTKRERRYCNNQCAARKSTRDRRENRKIENSADYVVEQKRNRERARKSYERKINEVLPNAQIQRRPRKLK